MKFGGPTFRGGGPRCKNFASRTDSLHLGQRNLHVGQHSSRLGLILTCMAPTLQVIITLETAMRSGTLLERKQDMPNPKR